jgi:hypothetical protein
MWQMFESLCSNFFKIWFWVAFNFGMRLVSAIFHFFLGLGFEQLIGSARQRITQNLVLQRSNVNRRPPKGKKGIAVTWFSFVGPIN